MRPCTDRKKPENFGSFYIPEYLGTIFSRATTSRDCWSYVFPPYYRVEHTPPRFGLTLPVLEVAKRSLALRVDRSAAIDVRAPVRIPGFCAGAVGGLPPPPAGFAPAAPPTKISAANATAAAVDAATAVSPEGVGDDGLVVAAVATGAGEEILWLRNPRVASLTYGKSVEGKGLEVQGC